MNKSLLIVLMALSLLVSGCGGQAPAPDPSLIQIQTPKPVIYDTGIAHEDVFSALFLLSHPNVDVRAITVTGTGEAHCGPRVENVLGLVTLSSHADIPVTFGVVGALLAPQLAAIGAIAALLTEATIVVEKSE
jgi:hypothetical protein